MINKGDGNMTNRIVVLIKRLYKISNEFGARAAIEIMLSKVQNDVTKYIDVIMHYLKPYVEYSLASYSEIESGEMTKKVPIWIFWWQGYENMPEICKCCYESVKRQLPDNADLILVTKDNYRKYVDVPDEIIYKVDRGIFTLTLFSDWLRNALIVKHGGFWIDSTIYCVNKIDEDFLEDNQYWSIKKIYRGSDRYSVGRTVTKCMWGGFIQKAPKGSRINQLVLSALTRYMLDHNVLLEYFIQNFIIRILYEIDANVRISIDNIPFSNKNLYLLADKMNDAFNSDEWANIKEDTTFFKLSWKSDYVKETERGEKTFYYYILNERANPPAMLGRIM